MKNQVLFDQVNQEEVVTLLQEMIRFNTVNSPGDEKPLAEYMEKQMKSFDMETEIHDLTKTRANVIGKIKGSGQRKALLFNGHLDTVPPGDVEWKYGPFSGEIAEGKIYGRGSADMKGGLAAMMIAAKIVKNAGLELEGDLIIAGTAGEETDSIGAIDYLEKGGLEGVGAIVIGEPSSCGINIAEKGAFWIEITTYGKTAHGAFPEQGVNAVKQMHTFLSELFNYQYDYEENDLLGHPSMNVSTINGGVKTNVVPDKCSITVDMRTVPGMDHDEIIKDIEKIIGKLKEKDDTFDADIAIQNNRPAVETDKNHPFVQLSQEVIKENFNKAVEPQGVNFYTDAAVFLPPTNLPAIFYGPGDANMAHQPNEHITIESLMEATKFYVAMIKKYLVE